MFEKKTNSATEFKAMSVLEWRDRIETWLKENQLTPKRVNSESLFWALSMNVDGANVCLLHNIQYPDSFHAYYSANLGETVSKSILGMPEIKRRNLMSDLNVAIASNPAVSGYSLAGKEVGIESFSLWSHKLFYEIATKQEIFQSIYAVRMCSYVVWNILDKYLDFQISKNSEQNSNQKSTTLEKSAMYN